MENESENLYRRLPQLGAFLDNSVGRELLGRFPRELVADAARRVLLRLRKEIEEKTLSASVLDTKLERLGEAIAAELRDAVQPSIRAVINATGVILQTNLGRAPLSRAALRPDRGSSRRLLQSGAGPRYRRTKQERCPYRKAGSASARRSCWRAGGQPVGVESGTRC